MLKDWKIKQRFFLKNVIKPRELKENLPTAKWSLTVEISPEMMLNKERYTNKVQIGKDFSLYHPLYEGINATTSVTTATQQCIARSL